MRLIGSLPLSWLHGAELLIAGFWLFVAGATLGKFEGFFAEFAFLMGPMILGLHSLEALFLGKFFPPDRLRYSDYIWVLFFGAVRIMKIRRRFTMKR